LPRNRCPKNVPLEVRSIMERGCPWLQSKGFC
jgi:hypothetical protein